VVHRGQQVDLPAVGVGGAAQRLAIDRDCPAVPRGVVAVGQPGADRCGQGVGVKPDVAVPADQALEKAHALAVEQLLAAAPDEETKRLIREDVGRGKDRR
jgi:hypothetical protein